MKIYFKKIKKSYPNASLLYTFLFCFFTFTVSVEINALCDPDTSSPVTICFSDVNISLPASGNLVIDPAFVDGGSHDNCTLGSGLSFVVNPVSMSCADIGTPVNAVVYCY